jgi:hypothetical protein
MPVDASTDLVAAAAAVAPLLIANADDHPDQTGHRLRLCAAAPMPPDTDRAWQERFGPITKTVEDAARDTLPVFEKVYEQWGRTFDVKVVEMSGSDESVNHDRYLYG